MKKSKRRIAMMMAATLCVGMLSGCGGGSTSAPADSKGSAEAGSTQAGSSQSGDTQTGEAAAEGTPDSIQNFTFCDRSPVIGLNPIMNTTAPDNRSHNLMYESLVSDRADENGEGHIYPGAAESWEISDDGCTYTFHMREGAVWNDGVPVTAGDFEYTFQKMADPTTGSTNAWLFDGVIVNFNEALYSKGKTPEEIGVKAVDDKTLEIQLTQPAGYFLDLLDGAKPVRKDKYEEFGDAYGSTPDKTVVNGPFIIESWDQNTQMTLVRNEKYWNAANVKPDKIEYKVIQEAATGAQAFIGGDVDVFQTTDSNWIKLLSEDENSVFDRIEGDAPEFLTFNCGNEYLQNKKIRLAFSLAIDREAFNNDLRDGMDTPIYSLMPDHTLVMENRYTDLVGGKNNIIKTLQEQYPDPKVLLEEGLKELGKDTDPSKIQIRYASRGTSEMSKKIAEWLQQQWKEKLGVTVTIDMMEWNIMWDKIDEGDYDIATGGWGPYYNEPSALLGAYDPERGNFTSEKTGWVDEDAKQFVKLLREAAECNDEQKKAELYLQAEELLVGTGVIAPTYLPSQPIFLKKYVKGYYATSTSQTDYSLIYTVGKPGNQ